MEALPRIRIALRSVVGAALALASIWVVSPAPSHAASTTIVIQEVEADSPGTVDNEWIELLNKSASAITLTGWTVTDNGSNPKTIPTLTIQPGDTALITNDLSSFAALHPELTANCAVEMSSWFSGLANTGDRVLLNDSAATTVDQMSYGTDTTAFNPSVPVTTSNTTQTLERLSGNDTDTAADWAAGAETPCVPDSDAGEDTDDDGKVDGADSCPAGDTGWTSNATTDNDSDGCRDAGEDTDDDNDTVADDSDSCRTLAASTASGCPAATRSLTLSYSAKKEKFKGKLTASEPSCVSNDLVTVWKKRSGDHAKIGEDEVSAQGKYVVSKRGRPGRYYSTVDERVVSDVAACESATSPTLRLR